MKLRKTDPVELELVRGQETQSDKIRGDVGAIHEAKPKAFLCQLRQAPEHYKSPTSKAINYICYMYYCIKW
jgi:hypothetical protein